MNTGSREYVQRVLRGEREANSENGLRTTALTIASYFGDIESVKRLLSIKGIDVNKQTEEGQTPLMTSAAFNRAEIVKLLLADKRVDVNIQDNKGFTALEVATFYNNEEIANLLR